MTKFWQRRIYTVSVLWSAVIIALYAAGIYSSAQIAFDYLTVTNYALAFAITAFILSAVLLAISIPNKLIMPLTLLVYICQLASTALLILDNGGVLRSPYIFLWSILGLAAFSMGILPAIFMVGGTFAYLMLGSAQHNLQLTEIIYLSLSTYLPLILSYVIWGPHMPLKPVADQDERNYHELASELRQVAGKSEVVINAIDDGVIALDGNGTIELINPAAQRMIGWGKHDALGLDYKSVLKLVDNKNQPISETNDPVAKTLASNQQLIDESLSLVTSAGKHIMLSIVATPVGQMGAGAIVVFRNVTRQKAEEREQTEFISTASHEMRTPVASIEGYLGLALNPATATIDNRAKDFITKAHAAAQHLGHLFQDLLDVTKADDGRIVTTPQVIDLIPLISEVVEGFSTQAMSKQLHLIFNPAAGVRSASNVNPIYYIDVDINHFREVLSNLIENAIKYTQQGDIVVDVNGDDSHVTISIRDTGIGIPKEDQSHLFQKFYRVDNSDTRTIGGTGLGLYLCRKLTESMSGRIWVESEYQKGSTFYLDFPRLSQEEAMRRIDAAAINATLLPTSHHIAPNPTSTPQNPIATSAAQQASLPEPTSLPTPPPPLVQTVVAPQPQPVQPATRTAPAIMTERSSRA